MTEPIVEYTTRDFSAVDRQISEIANREKVLTRRLHIGNIKRIIIIAMGVLLAFGLFLILAGIAYRIAFKPAVKIIEKTSAIELSVKSEPIKIESGKIDLNITADPIKIKSGTIDINLKSITETGAKNTDSSPEKGKNENGISENFFPDPDLTNRDAIKETKKVSKITKKIQNIDSIISNSKSNKEIEITQLKENQAVINKEDITKIETEILSTSSKIINAESKKEINENTSKKLFKAENDDIDGLEQSIKNLESVKERQEIRQKNLSKEVNFLEKQLKKQQVELSTVNNGGVKERELRTLSDEADRKTKELQDLKEQTGKIRVSSLEQKQIAEQETKTKIENIQSGKRMDKIKQTRKANEALNKNLKTIEIKEVKKLSENETKIKIIKKELKKLSDQEKKIESTNDEEITENQIEKLNEEIQKTKANLEESKLKLKASDGSLAKTKSSEDEYKSKLEGSKNNLNQLEIKTQNELKVIKNLISTLEQEQKDLQKKKQLLQKTQSDSLEKAIETIEKKYGKTIEELIAKNQILEKERKHSRKKIEELLNKKTINEGAIGTKTSVTVFKMDRMNFKGFTSRHTGHKYLEKNAKKPVQQHCYIVKGEVNLQLANISETGKQTSLFKNDLSKKYNINRSEWNQQISKCVWFK